MTGTNFATYVRYLTQTDTGTLTDAELVLLMNVEKDNLAQEIATNVDESYFVMPDTRDLEADIRNYTYPTDFLKSLKYVAAKLDGTNLVYLREVDFGYIEARGLPLLNNTHIKDEFSDADPRYLLKNNELVILSGSDITAVTGGLVIESEVYPEDFTTSDLSGSTDLSIASTTTAVRLPRPATKTLAKMVSIAYKTSKDKPLPLTEDERLLPIDKEKLFESLRGRNAVRVITGKVPYNDGSNY